MNNRRIRFVISASLLLFSLLSSAADQVPHAEVIGSATYDFGSTKHGQVVTHGFTIRNSGSAELVINSVDFTMPGMKARFKGRILPGKDGTVVVEWDTSKVKGRLDAQAVVRTSDPEKSEIVLTLQGVIRMPIEVKPIGAFYVSANQGEIYEDSLTISVGDEAERLELADPQVQGSHFTASVVPMLPGREYQLTIHVPSDLAPGRYKEAVVIATNNPSMPQLRVPVNILIKGDVYVSAETIDFGRVPLSELGLQTGIRDLLTQTVLVKKRSGPLQVTSVSSDLSALNIKRDPASGPSAIHRIDVGLKDANVQPGKIKGTLRIETDDAKSQVITIPITGEFF